jgi:hypothetical protein
LLGVAALGALAQSAGCDSQTPAKSAPPEALCPATMKGEGTAEYPLSGLTIIRFETGKGSMNVTPSDDANHKEWLLTPTQDVHYRAACEYDEEIIGIPIGAAFRRCWLERGSGSGTRTWCAR